MSDLHSRFFGFWHTMLPDMFAGFWEDLMFSQPYASITGQLPGGVDIFKTDRPGKLTWNCSRLGTSLGSDFNWEPKNRLSGARHLLKLEARDASSSGPMPALSARLLQICFWKRMVFLSGYSFTPHFSAFVSALSCSGLPGFCSHSPDEAWQTCKREREGWCHLSLSSCTCFLVFGIWYFLNERDFDCHLPQFLVINDNMAVLIQVTLLIAIFPWKTPPGASTVLASSLDGEMWYGLTGYTFKEKGSKGMLKRNIPDLYNH